MESGHRHCSHQLFARQTKRTDLFGVQRLPAEYSPHRVTIDLREAVRGQGELCLCIDHLEASLHEDGLVEEATLAEQQTGVLRRQIRLEVLDADLCQVRQEVLLGAVEHGEDGVRLHGDLVRVEVSAMAKSSTSAKWATFQSSLT